MVVRSYGWTVLLADQGPVNWLLLKVTGVTSEPVSLVFNLTGVVLSLTHVFLPFVVFPIYSSMTRLDPALAGGRHGSRRGLVCGLSAASRCR